MVDPYSEQAIDHMRKWAAGDLRVPSIEVHEGERETTMSWLATYDAIRARCEVAEAKLGVAALTIAQHVEIADHAERDRDAARERVGVLSKFLQEARDEIEEWGAYAPDYFKEKWDLPGVLARFDAALRKEGEGDDA